MGFGLDVSNHIALLGDSIFDNQSYTSGQPDVVAHLRQLLPSSWQATLCAVDGATTVTLASQLPRIPPDATHLVVSIGGNDALMSIDLLATPVSSTTDALALFAESVAEFELKYRAALEHMIALGRPTTTCTIYNGRFPAEDARIVRTALMLFNDAILRVAFERQLPVIDLRSVCNEPADYANPIEPSGPGGRKIAEVIGRAVGALQGTDDPSRVFTLT